jgi:septal ring-binding cell division protein DamX
MSDYLWDKSGEPDAEVQRLETLLGELRFEPGRKLELPPEMTVPARSRSGWYAAFAVAAALALMILAGVWFAVVRRHSSSTSSDLQVVENSTGVSPSKPVEPAPAAPRRANEVAVSGESESASNLSDDDDRAAPRPPDRVVPASLGRPSTRRSYQSDLKRRAELASNARQQRKANSPEMLEAERAKDQLMLALHVASAKINLAQRKAPGITGVSPGGSY